ncbi:hypothetical protein [Dyella caseinilytica]|uniref:DUF2884 family protein n=1 Tax=Dyella caseinilytica TaxID=1849581 RepID=A0ABX7GYK7_9GAMM|nr:hypothetical protein [Dyella caseinilytica]QRN55108.1 hypothetical protein ISN74_07145 [Dyella caseinilytica]GFZ99423.1 hypothetical protein GCM10011408_20150 [Dyella caseinilytica]
MKYQRTILLLALCTAISACDIPDTSMEDGAITLKDNIVTLHVSGTPDAAINANGDLEIADKVITINPAQRGLLMLYYQNVHDVSQTGKEMGKVGAGMGVKALANKVQGKSKTDQDQDASAGADQLSKLSQKMCQDSANIKTVQDQLSAQLAEFKPYGNLMTQKSVTSCQNDNKN